MRLDKRIVPIIAWGAVLSAIFLYTLHTRDCVQSGCIGFLEVGAIFASSILGGLLLAELRQAMIGMFVALAEGVAIAYLAIVTPVVIGASDLFLAGQISDIAVLRLFQIIFPIGIVAIIIGTIAGDILGDIFT